MLILNAVSAEFFHTDAGTAFVDLLINGNRETWPIRSKRFRTWLRRRHYEATRTAASTAAIKSALDLLEAQAQFEGPERALHLPSRNDFVLVVAWLLATLRAGGPSPY